MVRVEHEKKQWRRKPRVRLPENNEQYLERTSSTSGSSTRRIGADKAYFESVWQERLNEEQKHHAEEIDRLNREWQRKMSHRENQVRKEFGNRVHDHDLQRPLEGRQRLVAGLPAADEGTRDLRVEPAVSWVEHDWLAPCRGGSHRGTATGA